MQTLICIYLSIEKKFFLIIYIKKKREEGEIKINNHNCLQKSEENGRM